MIKHKQIPVPPQLSQLPDAPETLFGIGGNLKKLLDKPRVAIVGARKMSPYGQSVTEKLASELAGKGVVIVSGLAYGVDVCAHQAALEVGGQCIAVLACGLDRMYPAAHARIGEEIIARGGVILSEYPDRTTPMQYRFLERNRLISGLSDAVIITEAAQRSGTLNTAAHALNHGKPVLCAPGNITSQLSAGTNNLLKSGATPVTSVEDILSVLGMTNTAQQALPLAANQHEFILLSLIKDGTSDGGELLRQSQLDAPTFNQTLTMLEITAKIKPLGANQWALA
jgi:DNA processing protein